MVWIPLCFFPGVELLPVFLEPTAFVVLHPFVRFTYIDQIDVSSPLLNASLSLPHTNHQREKEKMTTAYLKRHGEDLLLHQPRFSSPLVESPRTCV